MAQLQLSVLMAVYNEANSVRAVLERVATAIEGLQAEIIVVDNGSHDHSADVIEEFTRAYPQVLVRLFQFPWNAGKGAAIRHAINEAHGEFCLIQDADFEYDPVDYPQLLNPLIAGEADVVMGSRFLFSNQRRPLPFWQSVVNHLISTATGLATGLALSDVETGFKAFRTSLAQSVPLHSNTFGLDPELVVQFAKRRARFIEVPIHYRGRTPEQGKKFSAAYKDPGANILATMSKARRFNNWMAATISPYLKGEVLELGAGIGNLTMLLASGVRRYIATDTDAEALCELRARLEYRREVVSAHFDFTRPEEIGAFKAIADTVVCLNVLEHIPDDRCALAHIKTCLRPQGRAIVLVPQGPELFGKIDEVLHHQRRYTLGEIVEKMTDAGFRVEKVIEFNRATRPGWYLNSKVLRRATISRVQLALFDRFVPLLKRIDDKFPWAANSLIVVGVVDDAR